KTVRQQYRTQFQALNQSVKSSVGARQNGQRPDSTARVAVRQRREQARTQELALMTKLRGDLRNALNPENRARFDANAAQIQARLAKRGAPGKAGLRRGKVGTGN